MDHWSKKQVRINGGTFSTEKKIKNKNRLKVFNELRSKIRRKAACEKVEKKKFWNANSKLVV